MAAEDMQARLSGWAVAEAQKGCFGEDYDVAVTLTPQAAQTPQGVIPLPVWMLLIATRSPLLGEGPMYHMVPLGGPVPAEDFVRKQVTDGIAQLRNLRSSKLSGMNGHSKALAGT